MTDFSVFWCIPIIFLFLTWFVGSVPIMIKEAGYKWLWPLPILFVIALHLMNFYSRESLNSMVWGSSKHMGYYQALLMFGNTWHQWFNWTLLGIDALYLLTVSFICLFNLETKAK